MSAAGGGRVVVRGVLTPGLDDPEQEVEDVLHIRPPQFGNVLRLRS